MENLQEEQRKLLKKYIKKGYVHKDAIVEFEDGDPFIDEKYITLPVSYVISDGYVDCKLVIWL